MFIWSPKCPWLENDFCINIKQSVGDTNLTCKAYMCDMSNFEI